VLTCELPYVIPQPEQGSLRHRLALVFIYRLMMAACAHVDISKSLELLLA
jgi:hypothetical protein